MSYEIYFPRGIAKGNAFCNRENERNRLIANIKSRQHTLIMSPRRYGKTSLVKYAVDELPILFGEADLFVAVDAKRVEQQILAGVKKIISEINTPIEQVLEIIRQYFKKTSAKWTVGTQGVNIALIPEGSNDPATTIMEALQALEDLLSKKNKQAVFFLDEIQEIGEVAEGKGIEGALRHVAQQTHYLSFVFSGSNRHLLARMFYDKARPLYKLCDRIVLDRIDEQHYRKHINKLARKRWNSNLDDSVLEALFTLTERHPFYMNGLCLRLWESDLKRAPSSEDARIYWINMVTEERQEIARELSTLSAGQRKILIAITEGHTRELTGKVFLNKIYMTSSSVVEALKILEQRDYIERKTNGEYHFIDPLMAAALRLYFNDKDF
ncbi:MAG: ATP-binding protein [Gammaproteobacteria bacterium]|nr:MAG: ATP-binding protein [Gammaproteobacteria bacterium]